MEIKAVCIKIILGICVMICFFGFHIGTNAYYYSMRNDGDEMVNLAGIIVNGALAYDLMMWALLIFQFINIILILYKYWRH